MGLGSQHKRFDEEADRKRGLARFAGHVGIFFGVPQLVAAIAEMFGVGLFYFIALPWLLIPAGIAFIYAWEAQDYIQQRNGIRKGWLDFTSKSLGWTLGVGTWMVWWI